MACMDRAKLHGITGDVVAQQEAILLALAWTKGDGAASLELPLIDWQHLPVIGATADVPLIRRHLEGRESDLVAALARAGAIAAVSAPPSSPSSNPASVAVPGDARA